MNFQQYFATATFTELSHDPILWVAVVFAVVAATVSVAGRKNVGWGSSRAYRANERHEMIHRKNMEQTSRATTIGATAIEVAKSELPIGISEVNGKGSFSSDVTMIADSQHFQIPFAVLATLFFFVLYVLFSPYAHPFSTLFGIGNSGQPETFLILQSIFAPILENTFSIFLTIFPVVLAKFLAVGFTIGRRSRGMTGFAFVPKPIFGVFAAKEIVEIGGKPLGTFFAKLKSIHRCNYTILGVA